MTSAIQVRIQRVQERIAAACQRADRDPSGVTLIAVTKTVGRPEIDLAYQAGIRHFGENRVQAAAEKFALSLPDDATSHMIGSLLSNKAGPAVECFDLIHSVDRSSLIQELQRQAERRGKVIDVLLQINVARDPQKAGCDPDEAVSLARCIAAAPSLKLRGLMCMAPFAADPAQVRPVFAAFRDMREQLRASADIGELPILSMGMTNDFEIAIEEGATHVRIGQAIFEQ